MLQKGVGWMTTTPIDGLAASTEVCTVVSRVAGPYQLCQKLCQPLPQLCQPLPQLCQFGQPQPPLPQPPCQRPQPPLPHQVCCAPGWSGGCGSADPGPASERSSSTPARIARRRSDTLPAAVLCGAALGLTSADASAEESARTREAPSAPPENTTPSARATRPFDAMGTPRIIFGPVRGGPQLPPHHGRRRAPPSAHTIRVACPAASPRKGYLCASAAVVPAPRGLAPFHG